MELKEKKISDVVIVGVKGRMDALTAPNFESNLCCIIDRGEKKIVIDLGELEYISSAGLRAVLSTAKRVKAAQGSLAFANLSGMVSEVFDISGFTSMFSIFGTVLSAVEKMDSKQD